MNSHEAPQWRAAMDEEISSFNKTHTWDLKPRPRNVPVLKGKWVYKKKYKADGSILHKARWVVRGFEQQYGVNFNETFASAEKQR